MNYNLKDCENASSIMKQIAVNLKALKEIPLISENIDYVEAIEDSARKLNILMSLMLNDLDKHLEAGE